MHCVTSRRPPRLDLGGLKGPGGDVSSVVSSSSSEDLLKVGVSKSSAVTCSQHGGAPCGQLTPDVQLSAAGAAASPPSFLPSAANVFAPCAVGGRYILLGQLDERPMYKCVNIETGEEFTCKIVNNDGHRTLAAHFRLDRHEHINEIVEVLVSERHTYVIFRRSYGDLHSYVRTRRRLREAEGQRLFRQVASAVRHCHRNGVVLRDLKLRRFVFKDPERTELKLESLEDVVVMEDEGDDTLDDKHGCPAYVSPEILTPNGSYSGRAADVWSMGVMLYAMLVGRYPFHDNEPNMLFNKIRSGHYTIPETVSPKARCLIRSLLRYNPAERLTADDVVRHPWLRKSSSSPPPSGGAGVICAATDLRGVTTPPGGCAVAAADQLVPEMSAAKRRRRD